MVNVQVNSKYSWAVLIVLLLVYISNQWDRYLFNYLSGVAIEKCKDVCKDAGDVTFCDTCPAEWALCEQCHQCLTEEDAGKYNLLDGSCISNSQYGFLAGFAFSALYVVVGLFAGRLSDLYNRKIIIGFAIMWWSLATAAHGLSNSFAAMTGARIALGVGEAFSAPPSYSLIADYFSEDKRATANGIYSFGVYVGGGLSSLSLTMATFVGWRLTAFIVAIIGGVFGLIAFIVLKEPRDRDEMREKKALQEQLPEEKLGTVEAIKISLSKPTVLLCYLASSLRFLGGYAIGAYLPIYFKRAFPEDNQLYGVLNAAVVSVGGALSSYLGGYICDRWTKRTVRARAWVPAIGALLGIAPFIATLFWDNFYAAIVGLFFEYLFAECWFGPALSILQNELPGNVRGTAISVYLFTGAMVGNISPAVIGAIDDGTLNIRYILLVAVVLSYGGCAIVFFIISILLKNETEKTKPLLEK